MFADIFRIHRLASGLSLIEIKPSMSFKRDQPIFADPGDAIDLSFTFQNEVLVGIIEQYRREAGD